VISDRTRNPSSSESMTFSAAWSDRSSDAATSVTVSRPFRSVASWRTSRWSRVWIDCRRFWSAFQPQKKVPVPAAPNTLPTAIAAASASMKPIMIRKEAKSTIAVPSTRRFMPLLGSDCSRCAPRCRGYAEFARPSVRAFSQFSPQFGQM